MYVLPNKHNITQTNSSNIYRKKYIEYYILNLLIVYVMIQYNFL